MLKNKKFDKQLEKVRQEASKKYKDKTDTVVCQYCGKLLNKNDGSCIYDLETKELTFCHDECFDKYEPHGDKIIEKKVE